MQRKKTKEEEDIFKYVLCDQLIHQGILNRDEEVERRHKMEEITNGYVGFLDDPRTCDKRMSVSHGIVRRRNATLNNMLKEILNREEYRLLMLHIYQCIEHGIVPDTRILTAHLNIDYEA